MAGPPVSRNSSLSSALYGWLVEGIVVVGQETEGDRVIFWQPCSVQAQTDVT